MANTNDVTFEIVEHIGTIDVIDGREEKWTKEVNVVAWNGGKPKALVDRFRARSAQEHATPIRDAMER